MVKLFPLKLISQNLSVNFMGKRMISFIFSVIVTLLSIILVFTHGVNFGIDFTGGIIIEAQFEKKPDIGKIHSVLNELSIGEISLQDFDDTNVMIRVGLKSNIASQSVLISSIKDALISNISSNINFRKIDFVGPQVGTKLIQDSLFAVFLSLVAIMIYVGFRFEWQFGIGIVIALLHDIIFTIGIISISAIEFNLTTVAAILTIIGYSVNDSVVIYDRIRENMAKYKKKTILEILNLSINETLSRTILTVVTTLISLLALIIYGGAGMHSFSVVSFVGIIIGTYSSIYISAPVLINLGIRKLLRV